MNSDKKQRNSYLDIMKGISIFLVLLGHSIQYGSKISYVGSRLFFNDPVFKLIYSFHMPLFVKCTWGQVLETRDKSSVKRV